MTAALLTVYALPIFGVSALLAVAGLVVQFDGTVKNDAAGKLAMKVCAPIALLTGAIMWWPK